MPWKGADQEKYSVTQKRSAKDFSDCIKKVCTNRILGYPEPQIERLLGGFEFDGLRRFGHFCFGSFGSPWVKAWRGGRSFMTRP